MPRVFGPKNAPGVRLEEQDGEKTIEPAAIGWVAYAGMTQKGRRGELSLCATKTEFRRRHGGIIPESLLPDAANDFYNLANGAGGIAVLPITDGNEVVASITLYARNPDTLTPMGRLDAYSGGRWGGKWKRYTNTIASSASVTNTVLTTGVTMKTDEWKGGVIEFKDVANKQYPIIGNTAAGVITVAADQKMLADLTAAVATYAQRFYLKLDNEGVCLSAKIDDGETNGDSDFSIEVFVDGASVKKWGDLNADPASPRYWVNIINNDDDNVEVTAVDLWSGAYTPYTRPANWYGTIASTGVTKTTLTSIIHEFTISSPVAGGNPTLALGTTTDNHLPQTITITMTAATTGTAVSDKYGALGTVTLGSAFTPSVKWAPPFTVTAGLTALVSGDVLTIVYKPLPANAFVGGWLYPDKENNKRDRYRITANTHKIITVAAGSDLTTLAADGEDFMVSAALEFVNGRDGHADVVDADYESQAWDTTSSPYDRLEGKNMGLVKFATPGVTSTTVQKAGVAWTAAKNYQYRYEVPSNVTTENGVIAYINETLGRNDYAVVSWPSYGCVPDPDPAAARANKQKLISLTGMIHGRETSMAFNWDGYHKAAAGLDATLPRLLKTPLGDRKLDEERLNQAGIGMIKKKNGNWILWGGRTLWSDITWKWKHQRELMSHYEHVLQENFDWVIFAINDKASDALVKTALISYFMPEWSPKRALRGDTFEKAAIIKVDAELNTDLVRNAGDKIASISLRLADTTERLVIRIGKQGIFEN